MVTVLKLFVMLMMLLFLASVIGKLDAWESWVEAADSWLPRRIPRRPFVISLPLFEALTILALAVFPGSGLLVASALLSILGAGVLMLSPHHRGSSCGCFGTRAGSTIGPALGVRNLALSLATLLAALLGSRLRIPAIRLPEVLLIAVSEAVLLLIREVRFAAQRVSPG